MSLIESLQNRALDKTCNDVDSQLMIDAAEHIMDLETDVAYLRSVVKGEWPGTPE